MTKLASIQYLDDLDNEPVALDDLVVKEFSIDGVTYRIDLRTSNASAFDAQMAKWIRVASRRR